MRSGSRRGGSGRGGSNTKIISGIVILAAVFGAIFFGLSLSERLYKKDHPETEGEHIRWIDDNTVYIDSELYGFDHRIETYLFVGTDNSGNEQGVGEAYRGALADYLLLLVMDHTTDTYGAIPIDRNTVVEVDMIGTDGERYGLSDEQICTAHWYGRDVQQSAENTVNAVKKLLGELEYIDGYMVLNMEDVGLFNRLVGGVDVPIEDDMENVDPAFVKGTTVKLDDEQAEKYVRARMTVGEGDNASRMRRQQTFMDSFFRQAEQSVRANPKFAQTFWNELRDHSVTDMTGNDFSRIGEKMRSGKAKGFLTIEGEHTTGFLTEDGIEHEEFYPDADSIYEVMNELFTLVHIEDEDEDESEDLSEDLSEEDDWDEDESDEDLSEEDDWDEDETDEDWDEDESE